MTLSRICRESGVLFSVSDDDLVYYDRVSPVFCGIKYSLPPPTLSPQMRLRRRLCFRNERSLFRRKCDLTGRQIISIFSPDSPYIVYDQEPWWSDRWDALSYGREYDFSRPFIEQFRELNYAVPHLSLYTRNVENSYYTNYAVDLKNCYLSFGTVDAEDCLYCRCVWSSRDLVDGLSLFRCELCYEGVQSDGCYGCCYFTNCRNCSECFLIESCHECRNCTLCFGLHRKEYCIFNEEVGPERYAAFRESLLPLTADKIAKLSADFARFKSSLPHRQSYTYGCEDCSGDALFDSKNCQFCFNSTGCEDSKFLCDVAKAKNCYDGTYAAPYGPEFSYEFCSSMGSTHSLGIFLCWRCHAALYSMECQSCSDIFGCVGLRNKQYCIFNRQYQKDDYERLAGRIAEQMQNTGEWGEFLSQTLSYFGYNQTAASELFPLSASVFAHSRRHRLRGIRFWSRNSWRLSG